MNLYLGLKTVHIISSVVLVGTGFGSAFYLYFANRSGSVAARSVVSGLVVRADTWFTTPAGIIQPLTGIALARIAGWPLQTPWLLASIALFLLAGACWLPVLWLQWRMHRMSAAAAAAGLALDPQYERYARVWEWLGYPAFAAMLAVFYLMVNKPALWAG